MNNLAVEDGAAGFLFYLLTETIISVRIRTAQLKEVKVMTQQEIGEKVRAARKKKGLTQTELGVAIGLSQASSAVVIRGIESGRVRPPYERLRALADTLRISLYDLVP